MFPNFKRQVIVSAAIIGGSLVVFGIAFWQLDVTLSSQTAEIIRSRDLITGRTAAVVVLSELKNIAPQVTPYERAMNVLLPVPEQLLDFPRYLDGLAKLHNVTMSFSFQESRPSEENSPGFTVFTLNAGGDERSVLSFLREIESPTARFLVNIGSVTVARLSNLYQLNMQGRVFTK